MSEVPLYMCRPPMSLRYYPPSSYGTASATPSLGRSHDVFEGGRFPVEGERCIVSS